MQSDSVRKFPRRFTIVSTCPDAWGGSEELWSGAASVLAEGGHRISVFKKTLDKSHPRFQRLRSLSCSLRTLRDFRFSQPFTTRWQALSLCLHLLARRPNLVIVSQGDNYDGLHFGYLCLKLRIPYVLICQKATESFWPHDAVRKFRREVFMGAAQCFFVSDHNRRVTEEHNGMSLSNAKVVRNPYLAGANGALPWPGKEDQNFRLACVARLFPLDKGQDVLLRVLARDKWKDRRLHVSFYGSGINGEALAELASRLGVTQVSFSGHVDDVESIWKNHHALILPSRAEGLPLALVEAMMCGRPAIVTNVGGNAEIVEDGVTGFVPQPFEDAIDAALEDAWLRRSGLKAMGRLAAARIRELVPSNPAQKFAQMLLQITDKLAAESAKQKERLGKPGLAEGQSTTDVAGETSA